MLCLSHVMYLRLQRVYPGAELGDGVGRRGPGRELHLRVLRLLLQLVPLPHQQNLF